ncbi:MAG: ferric reductase-like transmembrane domain-containing protein [Betaproteobacteria bacterium]|nr:ferric reductase-like transmembrane domain-containing protein [Betaproteobacteria bacterium]
MRAIQYTLVGILLLVTALWSLADSLFPQTFTWFAFLHGGLVQYTGVLVIAAMSAAMVLATRPVWLEKWLGGLDKMYRLHKWLGITALTGAVVHWIGARGVKWLVEWGWMARPERGNRPELSGLEAWLTTQRKLAETIGEWAFYIIAILLVLALIKKFPYHWFAKTHKWLAALFLAFVFHSIVLVKFAYWTEPIGIVVALCLLAGTVSAVLVLLGKVGKQRKVTGKIAALKHYPDAATLEVTIALEPGWQGHAAGQFAFVSFGGKPHPFTIASAWNKDKSHLVFLIKALGDYTGDLPKTLQIGQAAIVEGPYGRFTFESDRTRQIWIGAGIGITPFLARLEALAKERGTASAGQAAGETGIDLFHPVAECPPEMEQKLRALAEEAGVRLHLIISPRDGFLNGERIRSLVPDWKNASLWFCGPAAFGQTLRVDFAAEGASTRNFHQELFAMR